MSWSDFYLLCFAVGALWSLASLLLGSFHVGHGHAAHLSSAHGSGLHGHSGHAHGSLKLAKGAMQRGIGSWLGSMLNPSCAAVFLGWFGGIGYLMTRHSGLGFWIDLLLALVVGLIGAWMLAAFLRFLQSREQPLDPADYEMTGVLGHVSSTIRPDGVGEVIFVREGARRLVVARSEEGKEITRGEEVIVTRYDQGIAYVRTWEAMTGSAMMRDAMTRRSDTSERLQKETEHVE
jgi:membrane protein implicated in regulation of membrane protease activity